MAMLNIMALTVTATAALTNGRGVTVAGGVPGAGAAILGFARNDAAIGENVAVDVYGVAEVETGGAIAAGAAVEVAADGRVVTHGTGQKVGRMAPLQAAATAAGQRVEIVLIPH